MMRDLRTGVIGGGVVGQATARSYLEYVADVRVWDILPERRTDNLRRVLECDLIFVCLPTPQAESGMGLDCTALDNFFSGKTSALLNNDAIRARNWVLRSTVPIGTTRRLREQYGLKNLVHSPEFLTARCAATDAQMPARHIIGVPLFRGWYQARDEAASEVNPCSRLLDITFSERFPGIQTLVMDSDESEAVKLFQNGIFATTVSLWNELRSLTDKLSLDWDAVRGAILADGRISPSHTQVPGQDGKRGWGGACFPKDLSQLLCHFHDVKVPSQVLDGAWHRNFEYDREEGKP